MQISQDYANEAECANLIPKNYLYDKPHSYKGFLAKMLEIWNIIINGDYGTLFDVIPDNMSPFTCS